MTDLRKRYPDDEEKLADIICIGCARLKKRGITAACFDCASAEKAPLTRAINEQEGELIVIPKQKKKK